MQPGGYFPVHRSCTISNIRKIYVGINSTVARPGCYLQGAGTIRLGDYVQLAPNVGILSANHDLYDQRRYNVAPIVIGDYSWIGMNSIVTAGVTLGPRTIVAAGAVVTHSFPEGFCVLAGVPAKVVKYLDKDKFVPWHYDQAYYGYIPQSLLSLVNLNKYTMLLVGLTLFLITYFLLCWGFRVSYREIVSGFIKSRSRLSSVVKLLP